MGTTTATASLTSRSFFDGTNPTVRQPYNWIVPSGNFNTAANWDRNLVPGVGDTAVISSGTFTLPTNVTNTAGNVTVNVPFTAAADANYTLNIAGNWTFNGSVTLTSGYQFGVIGGGTASVAGITDVDGVNFVADGGSTLSFPNVTTATVPAGMSVTWTAQSSNGNQGTVLSFPNLTSIAGPTTPNTYLTLVAQYNNGATLSLPALTTITKADDGDQYADSGVELYANNGMISAPLLSKFSDNDSHPNSTLHADNVGVLALPKLLAPVGVANIYLNPQSNPQQFTSLVGTSSFEVQNGGTVAMSNLTSIVGINNITADYGTTLSFPNVTSYTVPAGASVTWTAQASDGRSTTLSFPNLTSIAGPTTPNTYLTLVAQYNNAATLSLPVLTTITKADDGDQYADSGVELHVNDGTISAPKLTTFQDNDSHPNSSLRADNVGVLALPKLLAPVGVANIYLNPQSNPQQFTSLVGTSSFEVQNGGTVAMTNLASITGFSSITADYGTVLSFPNVTSYTVPAGASVAWTAQASDGRSTTLSFPNLTSIAGPTTPNTYFNLVAQYNNAATLSLPVLTTITKADDGDQYADSGVEFYAHSGGMISVPNLSTFSDNDNHPNSGLEADGTGVLAAPKLLAPKGMNVINLNALSNPQQFTSLVGTSSFEVNEGTVVMSSLASIAGFSSITVDNGAQLSFPNVTSYTSPANVNVQWLSQHSGSALSFPNLTTITGPATPNTYLNLIAQYDGGATISLPALTTITKADDGDSYADSGVEFYAYPGGVIWAPNLATFKDNDSHPNSSLNVSGTGTMFLPSLAQSGIRGVTLNGVTLPATITSAPVASSVISSLPCTITTPGIYLLNANLSSTQTSGNLITVNASNVVINFQNQTISGPNTISQTTIGIYASEVTNVTIENGTVVHCNTGICLAGNNTMTTNNLNQHIDNMRVSKCNYQGIELTESPASLITNCQISQIGSSANTYSAGISLYGAGVTVQGCTISTITAASGSNSYCISSAAGSFARQNQLSSATIGLSGGIYQDNVARGCTTAFTNGTDAGGNSSD